MISEPKTNTRLSFDSLDMRARILPAGDSNKDDSAVIELNDQATCTISTICSHCDLDVPTGLIDPSVEHQFCCNGCKAAFELIQSCGMGDFYRYAKNKYPVSVNTKSQFQNFDTDYFKDNFTLDDEKSDCRSVQFSLEGLHCSACVWLIEKLPRIAAGVKSASVNWSTRSVTVTYVHSASLALIAKKLAQLGYNPTPFQPSVAGDEEKIENRKLLFNLGLAGSAAGNNMLVALAVYLGQYQGMTAEITRLLLVYSGLISLVSLLGPGRSILRKAIWSLRTRTPHMDVPVALGISIAVTSGWVNLFLGSESAYFDSISILVFVLLLGRYFQYLQQRSAINQVALLSRVTPQFCRQIVAGIPREVATQQIAVGDQIAVRANEPIPVDGVVISGNSRVDLSILTGESIPQSVGVGTIVYSGSTNISSNLNIEVTAAVNDSRVALMFRDVEESVNKKTRIVQVADKIGSQFVVVILCLAVITFLFWLPNWQLAANSAVALLIVACPCALALATPLAISVALSAAIKRKILIKDGDSFEHFARAKHIWFDKTGTLTEGKLQVVSWFGSEEFKPIVAALELHSTHPVSLAIVDFANSPTNAQQTIPNTDAGKLWASELEKIDLPAANVLKSSNGICGIVDGKQVFAGNHAYMEKCGVLIAHRYKIQAQNFASSGQSPVFVADRNTVVAIAAIGDKIRDCSKDIVEQLTQAGYQCGVLSGDNLEIVKSVSQLIGVKPNNVFAELLPEEKAKIVEESPGSVMIGDGVNDSSAIAKSDVAIAINNKSVIGSKVSPVVIGPESFDQVPGLLRASRQVMRLIYRNITISLLYNGLAVTFAFCGLITPLWAAILMPLSSISVVASSLTSKPFGAQDAKNAMSHHYETILTPLGRSADCK